MTATPTTQNRGLRATDRIQLRVAVLDAQAAKLGATTHVERARLCGMDRTNLHRIRTGQTTPSLELAMHMAQRLGLAVEELFERQVG